MATKTRPASRKAERVVSVLPGDDTDAYTATAAVRASVLSRHGIPSYRTGLIAGLFFGEARQ